MSTKQICKICGRKIVFLFTNDNSLTAVDYSSLSYNDEQLIKFGKNITFRNDEHIAHKETCKTKRIKRKSKKNEKVLKLIIKTVLFISLMIFAVNCTDKNNSSTISVRDSVNIIDSVSISYIDSLIITDSIRYIDSLRITERFRFIDSVFSLHDTIFTLKNIDNAALKSFISNFDDSLIYKTYAVVYLDTAKKNISSSLVNQKRKFIKWNNIIYEVYKD